MEVTKSTHAIEQAIPASRTAGRAAAVTALAAVVFLAMWSPISAEVAEGERNSPGMAFGGSSQVGGSEEAVRAKEADKLARDYGQWLRAAHGRAGAATEVQSLPPQF